MVGPARCYTLESGHSGCSTLRWEERLTMSPRLFREARRHPDLAELVRRLAARHEKKLPRFVRLGFEHGTVVTSSELRAELVAVSRCLDRAPPWGRALKRPNRACRLYTFFGFATDV